MLSEILYRVSRILVQSYAKLLLNMDIRWRSSLPAGPVLLRPTTRAPPTRS